MLSILQTYTQGSAILNFSQKKQRKLSSKNKTEKSFSPIVRAIKFTILSHSEDNLIIAWRIIH